MSSLGKPKRLLRGLRAAKLSQKHRRNRPTLPVSPTRDRIELAMQETFTHDRILYTVFDPLVNHILAALSTDRFQVLGRVRSTPNQVCSDIQFAPKCGSAGVGGRLELVG